MFFEFVGGFLRIRKSQVLCLLKIKRMAANFNSYNGGEDDSNFRDYAQASSSLQDDLSRPRNYSPYTKGQDDSNFRDYAQASSSSQNDFSHPKRHPPHLKGRQIGLFYKELSKKKNASRQQKQKMVVSMDNKKEEKIQHLFEDISSQKYEGKSHTFSLEYTNHINDSALREMGLVSDQPKEFTLIQDPDLDECLFCDMEEREWLPKYKSMQSFRQKLPAFMMREELVDIISRNQVVVIMGETGCGKTTQVPQYILDSFIQSRKGSLCKIVCTQPRRISAVSVAERVADERCVPCGKNRDVGYQIRLESKLPREQGSILFCTTGILLQKLRGNPYMSGISHIIVDEVHERNLDSDILLISLRDIILKRTDLKVILMSATLNAEEFSAYFGNCPMIKIAGYTFPVQVHTLEDMIQMIHYEPQFTRTKQNFRGHKQKRKKQEMIDYQFRRSEYLKSISNQYSRNAIAVLQDWNEETIDLYLIVEMLRHIHFKGQEGAVLVFLPGWAEINKLNSLLTNEILFTSGQFLIIPLHSLMPTLNQIEVFKRPPLGIRKVILATNIAETSITIDDIVYVIDGGHIKLKSFDHENNIQLLQPEWVALSNMKQREGRAGRTQPGICFHMFTKLKQSEFESHQCPEMLRTSLEETILKIKILKFGKAETFLNKAMNPPSRWAVIRSLNNLRRLNCLTKLTASLDSVVLQNSSRDESREFSTSSILIYDSMYLETLKGMGSCSLVNEREAKNALNDEENLTPLGYHLAKLPMDPHTGKMILFGAIFSCLDPILSIAASLSFKDAFTIPLGKEKEVDQMKKKLSNGSLSDHLTFAYVIKQWEEAAVHGKGQNYAWNHFLALSTLKMLRNLKGQYTQYLKELRFIDHNDPKHDDYNLNSDNELLIKAIVCAGLYPNVARVKNPKKSNRHRFQSGKSILKAITEDGSRVCLHPKSVNATEPCIKTGWLAYHLKVKSSRIFLHDTTAVTPYSLLFFGGELKMKNSPKAKELEASTDTVCVDDWIEFQCDQRKAMLVMDLRKELDNFLAYKITNPGVSNWSTGSREGKVLNCIIELITSEETLTVAELEAKFDDDDDDEDDDQYD